MSRHAFTQVDVFTDTPLKGNPVAVVHGADGLDEAQMRAVARWTNLSETTFVLTPTSPDADYRVRIFTPGRELPFAGHPTLGTCHAWLERGGVPKTPGRVVQQCASGPVAIRLDGARIAFAAPPVRMAPVDDTQSAFGAALYAFRQRIESAFGGLTLEGLGALPAWVRGARRVALWAAAKVLQYLWRLAQKEGLMA